MAIHGDLLMEAWMDPGNPGNLGKFSFEKKIGRKSSSNILQDVYCQLIKSQVFYFPTACQRPH